MSYDEYAARIIAGAKEFTACCFLGRAQYDTRRAGTLAGARRHANAILKERAKAGKMKRPILLYAIMGSQSVVAGTVQP